jgi:hypothetical protein
MHVTSQTVHITVHDCLNDIRGNICFTVHTPLLHPVIGPTKYTPASSN